MQKLLLTLLSFTFLTGSMAFCAIPKTSEELFQTKENVSEILTDYTLETGKTSNEDPGEYQLRVIFDKILGFIPKLLVPIAVLLLVYAGIELFLSRGKEETWTSKKNQILAVIFGFCLLALIPTILELFFGEEGEILRESDKSEGFAIEAVKELRGIYMFTTSFVVAMATLFLAFVSIKLILGGESEEEMTQLKKRVVYTIVGIIIIISVEKIVEYSTGKDKKIEVPDYYNLIEWFINIANYILGFLGIFAILALIWAGIRMVANFGDDAAMEEAKKIAISAGIGLVLAFSAYVIVGFLVSPQG
ncbi:MAG: pilin [Candidatus Peregrinibacteria bacterium]|nr:pilin [Candidatus Peregrinibacteria bacterium]